MNVIFLMNDTFRRDHLGCYGNTWIHTPNLDRLAKESVVFDRAYIGSYPTVPNRWDLATGRYGFPYRGWQPMDKNDVSLAQMLSGRGYATMFIHDTPMLAGDDMNYTRGFSAFRWVRGQHSDPYNVIPRGTMRLPAQAHKLSGPERFKLYFRNIAHRQHDREYMVAKSVMEATDWLEENHDMGPLFLWLDMWDPHEQFDPPWYDWDRYRDPKYNGDRITYPVYGRPNYMTPEEYQATRALYAGKVTLVDRWIGRLLETLELLGLLKNTLIIWTTDHGHLFGEHDLQGKPSGEIGNLYQETAHVPLFIRHPQGLGAGKRVSALAQPPDILPTVLEYVGAPIPTFVQGKSLLPLVTGEKKAVREVAFSCRFSEVLSLRAGQGLSKTPTEIMFDGKAASRLTDAITATTTQWAYICAPADRPSELYDLAQDPKQQNNVIREHPDVAKRLRAATLEFMKAHGAPPGRLRPFVDGEEPAHLPLDTKLWGFKDDQGLWITFGSEEQAMECVTRDAPGPKRTLTETTLGRILDADPKSLVRMWQYYWAQDLVRG